MLVGELAARTGVSARALRHYDAHALLPVERTANGYRDFRLAPWTEWTPSKAYWHAV